MSTLITGGGLIGSRAAELVRVRGDNPVIFDAAPLEAAGFTVERGDILHLPELLACIKKHRPERLLHTASLLTPAGQERPYLTTQVNLVGTLNVLEAARLEGIRRVVYCSSSTIYASTPAGQHLVPEDHPTGPNSVYAATKLAGEHLGRTYARLFGFEFVTVRFAAVYGPSSHPGGGVSRVVHDAVLAAARTGHATVPRRWRGTFELLHSHDAAVGLVAAAFSTVLAHDTYNVGSGDLRTVEEVAKIIAQHTGADVHVAEPQGAVEATPAAALPALDISRARSELNYAPCYDLESGIAELVRVTRTESSE